ncbi:SRPBCC family protein [Myxococcota bacterium]|nr:SRPBCC family protein [Myxococcota bacterium]
MAIEITEKMEVEVPLDVAWRFICDPDRVAQCMPGAELVEQVDEKTYLGKAKVKLGAITTAYKGRVIFDQVDEASHTMRLTGEGRETGGGTARGTLQVRLTPLAEGRCEMIFEISADLTGRVMQMGRGMIKGVSAQLFKQFAESARSALELEASDAPEAAASLPSNEPEAVAVGSLLGRTLWQMLLDFFKRLFGRTST